MTTRVQLKVPKAPSIAPLIAARTISAEEARQITDRARARMNARATNGR